MGFYPRPAIVSLFEIILPLDQLKLAFSRISLLPNRHKLAFLGIILFHVKHIVLYPLGIQILLSGGIQVALLPGGIQVALLPRGIVVALLPGGI